MIELLISRLKKILPDTIFNFLRRILTALFTPVLFSFNSGHFLSSIQSKAVDKKNNPIPWYTYSCIDFLSTFNFKNKKILEFGSGQSSIWWSKLSLEVHTLEDNDLYRKKITELNIKNLKIYDCDTYLNNFESFQFNKNFFDIIIIDGLDRFLSFKKSLNLISGNGIFIFDNSEGYHESRDDYASHPILRMMNENGYQRIDFYGYAPGVVKKHCTSIFHKQISFINDLNLNIKRF
jgi:hypothetical protein